MEPKHTNPKADQYTVSWIEYNQDIHILASKIPKDKYPRIYGIPRGGSIIAVHLSHLTRIPLSQYIYNDCLIVDDVSDTGQTLSDWRTQYNDVATLYQKDGTVRVPEYCVKIINKWIVFPWEH